MKKIVFILVALFCVISFVSCSGDKEKKLNVVVGTYYAEDNDDSFIVIGANNTITFNDVDFSAVQALFDSAELDVEAAIIFSDTVQFRTNGNLGLIFLDVVDGISYSFGYDDKLKIIEFEGQLFILAT